MTERTLDTDLNARELDCRDIKAIKCRPDCEYCSANADTIARLLVGRTYGHEHDHHLAGIKAKQADDIDRLEVALKTARAEISELKYKIWRYEHG
jgi:hypothetical protein